MFFLLLIPYKSSELPYFRVGFVIEIEAVFFSVSNLKKVVVEGLLCDADFLSGCLQRFLDVVSELVVEASVELPPECHLFNNLSDLLLLVLVVCVLFLVLAPLFFHQRFHNQFAFSSDFDSELNELMFTVSLMMNLGIMLRVISLIYLGMLKPKM